jgi:hypothetical protein
MRLTEKGRRWRDYFITLIGLFVFLTIMGYVGYVEGL